MSFKLGGKGNIVEKVRPCWVRGGQASEEASTPKKSNKLPAMTKPSDHS